MGLPHFTLDLRAEFRAGVVDPWLSDHAAGLTPNPCVRCNGHVRLDAMLDFGKRLGAPVLATGHYARVTSEGLLQAAADNAKDQSYMLARLDPRAVARMRFPLGDLVKSQVREIAGDAGLPVAAKPDSQDLCFLAGTGRAAFLAKHGKLAERPGDVLDSSGRAIGRHRGAHGYTIGQRRELGVGGAEHPLYVLRTDVGSNTVVVGPREALHTTVVPVTDIVLHAAPERVNAVRLRYRSRPIGATVDGDVLRLNEAFDAAAPGQLAVLLDGDVVVGYATISK
jgi:tRNA-specific 2-thiouridylase